MAKAKRKKKPEPIQIIGPTEEQLSRGVFVRANMAYKRVPVIETLLKAGKITQRQFDALSYYREQAHQAEDDYKRSSTLAADRVNGGGGQSTGSGIPIIFTPAIAETGRIERDLGSLLDIARAVAVDDLSLSQWCVKKYGGRERYNGKGEFVAIVPISERRTVQTAMLELKFAAGRITA